MLNVAKAFEESNISVELRSGESLAFEFRYLITKRNEHGDFSNYITTLCCPYFIEKLGGEVELDFETIAD